MSILILPAEETAVLRFIASCPNDPTVDNLISKLNGISREIALDIIGKNPNASSEVREVTEAMKDFAEKEKQKVLTDKTGKPKLRYATKEENIELRKRELEARKEQDARFKTGDKEQEEKEKKRKESSNKLWAFAGAMFGGALFGLFLGSHLGYDTVGAVIGATTGFIAAKVSHL